MAEFTLNIQLSNDAMQTHEDVANALDLLSKKLCDLGGDLDFSVGSVGLLRDYNGNTVGEWVVKS